MANTPQHPDSGQFIAQSAAEVTAAHDAGMTASQERRAHYQANTHGQDATCGDPMPAESTLSTLQSPAPGVPAKATL